MRNALRICLFFLPVFAYVACGGGLQEVDEVPSYINRRIVGDGFEKDSSLIALGRTLFYDRQLSYSQTISCASCHVQEFAFGDTATLSIGHKGGLTGRHSMRLVNTAFANEEKFFWDERAQDLRQQTTMPIQDHIEMGFSGAEGDFPIDSLLARINQIDYYDELFDAAYRNSNATELRIQRALVQFVHSIYSFDSRFDEGMAQVENVAESFPNFTAAENRGKALYLTAPNAGGAGCNRCHRTPEFAIGPNSANNGIVGVPGDSIKHDYTITRAPTLRDLADDSGRLNGPLMHDGSKKNLLEVVNHYNAVPGNPELDFRLVGQGGNLELDDQQKEDLVAFLLTLSGRNVYTDPRWSDPFGALR